MACGNASLTVLCFSVVAASADSLSAQSMLQSRAERTVFEETSRYQDVRAFLEALTAQSPRVRLEFFGRSEEGRELPLAVIGNPPAASPEAARQSGRPVVFVKSLVVRTDQPLGRLAFYLLEPESDDSLTTWNLFDGVLKPGATHPVLKVF
jgi:hypothetical protein